MTHSDCLKEIDLEHNLIGDLGGRELLEALMDRKEGKLRGLPFNLFVIINLIAIVHFVVYLCELDHVAIIIMTYNSCKRDICQAPRRRGAGGAIAPPHFLWQNYIN